MQILRNALQHTIDGVTGAMTEGAPVRIVLNNINSGTSTVAFRSYSESNSVPSVTLDPYGKDVWQHVGLEKSPVGVTNPPIEPHRIGNTIWVNVLKTGTFTSAESFWIGEQVGAIAEEVGCANHWLEFPTEFSIEYRTSQLSLGLWRQFEGICGAAHVPHTPSNGPGAMDLEAFSDGLVSGHYSTADSELTPLEGVIVTEEFTATITVQEPTLSKESEVSPLGSFPGRKVQLGSGGKAVQALRDAYGMGKGKFDEELLTHVLDAQNSAGMTTDGIVDSETWGAIGEALKDNN